MNEVNTCSAFKFWRAQHSAPYHFHMLEEHWYSSMCEDVDSDGRQLFDHLTAHYSRTAPNKQGQLNGAIIYGKTAFGFDESGEHSSNIHYNVIRDISFSPDEPEIGQKLLDQAVNDLGNNERIYAFFHYFGMSACARHGKLHESQTHVHDLLLQNGFTVEHENVYYARVLSPSAPESDISLVWKEMNAGSCREFAASIGGQEVCWGQVHFLPQGDIAYLRWIFTAENRQHQGIGTKVMSALFSALYSMGIHRFDTDTALDNIAAQRYYEKCGFINKGVTRSYYTK